MTSDYKADLEQANSELATLLNDRERLEIEIAKKRYRIAALMALTEQNEEIDQVVGMDLGGLTDACRTAFKSEHPKALTPTRVKERISQLGFPTSSYRNVMAAIHTVISRLFDARQIVPVETKDGETAYRWHRLSFGDRIGMRPNRETAVAELKRRENK
jgi:hypothetical protein